MLTGKFKHFFIIFFILMIGLSACSRTPLYNQSMANIADVKLDIKKDFKKSTYDALPPPALVVKNGMYVDKTPISLYHDPSWLHSHIVVRGDQLPFSYYTRLIASGGGPYVLTTYQPGLNSSVNISVNYSGDIKGALDLLASRTGYVYSIRGNNIFWQAYLTRTFDIAFPPGSSSYLLGSTSGSGQTAGQGGNGASVSNYVAGDGSSAEYSTLTGQLSVWQDLQSAVQQMLSPEGKVVVSQATTSVTVRDKPSNVQLVADYIHNLNGNISKQVLIKVQVLEVNLQNAYNFGINWNVIANAFHNTAFVINGNYGTPVSIVPLTAQNSVFPAALGGVAPSSAVNGSPVFGTAMENQSGTTAYGLLFNALSQQGRTSVVTEPRSVCMNNQVSVIRVTDTQSYVASIQNTTVSGVTSGSSTTLGTVSSTITPGSIMTGFTLYVLPKIMKNKVYLQVNADISTVNQIASFTSNGSSVQLPDVSMEHFSQRSVIQSGDILIMSGFKQIKNQANANQFARVQALGGRGAQESSKEIIILITPYILGAA